MDYNIFNEEKVKRIKISSFDATVTSKEICEENKNLLSDSKNIFNYRGLLQTRKSFCQTGDILYNNETLGDSEKDKFFESNIKPSGIYGAGNIFAHVREIYNERTEVYICFPLEDGQIEECCFYEFVGANGNKCYNIHNIYFAKHTPIRGSGIFLLMAITANDAWIGEEVDYVEYYELSEDLSQLIVIFKDELPFPVVYKNGTGIDYKNSGLKLDEPVHFCSPNILSGGFIAYFTADGVSNSFSIPYSPAENSYIIVTLRENNKNYEFYIKSGESASQQIDVAGKTVMVDVDRNRKLLNFFMPGDDYIPRNNGSNSIKLKAYIETNNKEFMLLSGGRPINADYRTFLIGGKGGEDKLFYSHKNDSLCFSETDYFEVGDNSARITALARQNRYIVAFKENEVFRISIQRSKEVSEKDLLEPHIKNLPIPSATVTRISDTMGCDRPNTVKVCGNRIVWFHSDGKVYTLYGSNLYSDGSVYEVSSSISDCLVPLKEDLEGNIFAFIKDGYYFLCLANKVFLMDTNVAGFRYMSSSRSKQQGEGLNFFLWELPLEINLIYFFETEVNSFIVVRNFNRKTYTVSTFKEDGLDTYADSKGIRQEPIDYYISTAKMGGATDKFLKIFINALFSGKVKIELFDENGTFAQREVTGRGKMTKYILPLRRKLGSVGVKIIGKGNCILKEIIFEKTEREF